MTDPIARLTAARFDGPQALYTEACAIVREMQRPLPDDLAGLVDAARRMSPRLDMLDCETVLQLADAIEALAAENARLSATAVADEKPACVSVKPLVWTPAINNKPWHSARAPWGWYYAQWDDETEAWFASLEMGEVEGPIILQPSDVQTIDAAKAAAQADFKARILPTITLRPEAEVRAEAWAAALEAAIEAAESAPTPDVPDEYRQTMAICDVIRTLITDDARAALDAMLAEAKAEGMREAASLKYDPKYGDDWLGMSCAILAAIPEAQK